MLKLAVAVLTLALAGVAAADGWRSLRVNASSEAAFQQSMALFQEKLSPARRQVFSRALLDIWRQGRADAEANQREYTASDYYQRLHGLSYEEVVTFTDPTGATANARHRDAQRAQVAGTSPPVSSWQNPIGTNEGAAHAELDSQAPVRTSPTRASARRRSTGQCVATGARDRCR